MNKKLTFILVGFAVGLLLVFLIISGIQKLLLTKAPTKNTEEIEKRITWTQKAFYESAFTTREDPKGQVLEDKQQVHLVFNSQFSLSSTTPIKKFVVTKVEFKQGVGTPMFIQPKHEKMANERSYIFTTFGSITAKEIVDSGSTYDVVVTNAAPTYYDEISNTGGFPNFAFITKNLGTISEQDIMKRDKIYQSARVLDYLNLKAEQLNGKLSIDFTITFEDGKVYRKRFTGTIDGSKVLENNFYTIELQ